MSKIDIDNIAAIMRDVAATEIMPRYQNLAGDDIRMKGINDPVTVADQAAERALTARLTHYLPGSFVVGEEAYAADKAVLSGLGSEGYVWVLDPIDGTQNYVNHVPEFAVMVGLRRNNTTIAAWILDPNTNDILTAELGGGVWLRGHRMRLAGQDRSLETVGLVGMRLRKLLSPHIASELHDNDLPPLTMGSAAAFDYGRLFTGDVLFADSAKPRASYVLSYRQAMAWDHVPGLLMIQEAGGISADWYGQPYDPSTVGKGLISAPDRPTWDRLQKCFLSALND